MDKLPPLSSEKNKPLTRKSFLDALTKFETAYQNICGRENSKEDEQGGKEYVEGVYSISPDALKSYFDSLNDAGVEILNPEEAAMVKVLEAASKYMNVYSLPNYELMDPELEISCLDQLDKAAVGEKTKAREENNFKKVWYWSDVANRVDLMKRLSQGDERYVQIWKTLITCWRCWAQMDELDQSMELQQQVHFMSFLIILRCKQT